jgi:uncharacterized membrane protein
MHVIDNGSSWKNVHPIERWASAVGGVALAVVGARRGKSGMLGMLGGAMMIQRGVTGRCHVYRTLGLTTAPKKTNASLPYELGIRVDARIIIRQPREVVWEFWRHIENLPTFMRHLVSVERQPNGRSHWIARGPAGHHVQWDAQVINVIPGELIGWRSLPGSDVDSAGSVHFNEAPGGGTEVRVELQYNPPAGFLGAYVAQLFGKEPQQEIEEDLERLKHALENELVEAR